MSFEKYSQNRVDRLNRSEGYLKYYDCRKCRNKGYIYYLDENCYEVAKDCDCLKLRKSKQLIESSGLSTEIQNCTFDNFKTEKQHQKYIKEQAEKFLADRESRAFYIGGQPGVGKTHICTAIVGKMLENCVPSAYMSWCQEAKKLKANVCDGKKYDSLINRYKKAEVLYIDDFLKVGKKENPTGADISLAFEIINYRYQHKELKTVISSEFELRHITDIDEALGSRIAEMAKGYCVAVSPDKAKNYRLFSS